MFDSDGKTGKGFASAASLGTPFSALMVKDFIYFFFSMCWSFVVKTCGHCLERTGSYIANTSSRVINIPTWDGKQASSVIL